MPKSEPSPPAIAVVRRQRVEVHSQLPEQPYRIEGLGMFVLLGNIGGQIGLAATMVYRRFGRGGRAHVAATGVENVPRNTRTVARVSWKLPTKHQLNYGSSNAQG